MSDLLPEIRAVLSDDRLMPLGPGSPNVAMRPTLEPLQRDLLGKTKDRDFALACIAGLWLYHDFLDESHAISQDLDTVEGSYWHAILHRREPDYWNAKYWFRRVPKHAIHDELARFAKETRSEHFGRLTTWDAAAFVDLCEKAAHGPESLTQLCRQIHQREFELLLRYCGQHAFA